MANDRKMADDESSDEGADVQRERTGVYVSELGSGDVLLGRGTGPSMHKGNIQFRQAVEDLKPAYISTNSRKAKKGLVRKAVKAIQAKQGRFLTKLKKSEIKKLGLNGNATYEVVTDDVAMEKTKQAIRYVHYKKVPVASSHKRGSPPAGEAGNTASRKQRQDTSWNKQSVGTPHPGASQSILGSNIDPRAGKETAGGSTTNGSIGATKPLQPDNNNGPSMMMVDIFPTPLNPRLNGASSSFMNQPLSNLLSGGEQGGGEHSAQPSSGGNHQQQVDFSQLFANQQMLLNIMPSLPQILQQSARETILQQDGNINVAKLFASTITQQNNMASSSISSSNAVNRGGDSSTNHHHHQQQYMAAIQGMFPYLSGVETSTGGMDITNQPSLAGNDPAGGTNHAKMNPMFSNYQEPVGHQHHHSQPKSGGNQQKDFSQQIAYQQMFLNIKMNPIFSNHQPVLGHQHHHSQPKSGGNQQKDFSQQIANQQMFLNIKMNNPMFSNHQPVGHHHQSQPNKPNWQQQPPQIQAEQQLNLAPSQTMRPLQDGQIRALLQAEDERRRIIDSYLSKLQQKG